MSTATMETKKRRVSSKTLTEPRRTIRDVLLEFEIESEAFAEQFDIIYRDLSAKLLRELSGMDAAATTSETDEASGLVKEVTEENRNIVAAQLSRLIVQIVGVVDEVDGEDRPTAMTFDFFDSLSLKNLKTINEAIKNDINPPKAQPAI